MNDASLAFARAILAPMLSRADLCLPKDAVPTQLQALEQKYLIDYKNSFNGNA